MGADITYFDKLDNRYIISGKIITTGSLHIGSGLGDNETDAKVMRLNDKPYIPGSSLKGYIRANTERLLASLDEKLDYTTCLLDKEYAKGKVECATVDSNLNKKLMEIKESDSDLYFKELNNKLCSVCKVFGSTELAAKLKISDGFLLNDYKSSIRDGIAIDRDTGTTKKGAKYDYEVIEKGAEFSFELIAENLNDGDLGLIALGLWDLINDKAAIGGNTSKGLGRVKLEIEEIEYFSNADGLLNYLLNSKLEKEVNGKEFLQQELKKLLSEVK